MTKLTVSATHATFQSVEDRPEGAILLWQEIFDGCIKDVWQVTQLGAIEHLTLLETCHTCQFNYTVGGPSSEWAVALNDNGKFQPLFLGQAGVSVSSEPLKACGQFQLFQTLDAAERYSDYCKTNDDYVRCVAAWWEECSQWYKTYGGEYDAAE